MKVDGEEDPDNFIVIYKTGQGSKALGPIADTLGITGQEFFDLEAENLENGDVLVRFQRTTNSQWEWLTVNPAHSYLARREYVVEHWARFAGP